MKTVSFDQIRLEDGFWKQKQNLIREVTIHSVYNRFKETGRIDAFRCGWKPGELQPNIYWDSDVAKWIESVAYLHQMQPETELIAEADKIIGWIAQNQLTDGYFNIYFQQCEPESRFKRRSDHELYCLGHLIEAAVAYHDATGNDVLLHCVERYIEYVYKVFVTEHSAGFVTPGHEEIELALMRLYHLTQNPMHLELCRFFIDQRGCNDMDKPNAGVDDSYHQSHMPVREQKEAVGHAVRAMYLYCAMADLAAETGDKELKDACRTLFEDVTERKMYITGGIGSLYEGEKFSEPYFLPHARAYAETCAAIGHALFSHRMLQIENNSIYADTVERALYNGVMAGLSLDGKSFFYVNPLEIDLKACRIYHNEGCPTPLTQRVEVFSCSCCPPNLTRIIPSVQQFQYTTAGDCLYVHQFMAGTGEITIGEKTLVVTQKTDYPANGVVTLTVTGYSGKLAVRVPGWSEAYCAEKAEDGYLYFDVCGERTVTLDFAPRVQLVAGDSRVADTCGRVAVCYGPLVYCLESVDNGSTLRDVRLDSTAFTVTSDARFSLPIIKSSGWRSAPQPGLYHPYTGKKQAVDLTFIPYAGFANRGESDMLIWVLC